MMEKLSHK